MKPRIDVWNLICLIQFLTLFFSGTVLCENADLLSKTSFTYRPYLSRIQYTNNYLHDYPDSSKKSSGFSICRYIGFSPMANKLYYYTQFGGDDFVEVVSMGGGHIRSDHKNFLIDKYGYSLSTESTPLIPIPPNCFSGKFWEVSEYNNTSRFQVLNSPFSFLGLFLINQKRVSHNVSVETVWIYSITLSLPIVSMGVTKRNGESIFFTSIISGFSEYVSGLKPGDSRYDE